MKTERKVSIEFGGVRYTVTLRIAGRTVKQASFRTRLAARRTGLAWL